MCVWVSFLGAGREDQKGFGALACHHDKRSVQRASKPGACRLSTFLNWGSQLLVGAVEGAKGKKNDPLVVCLFDTDTQVPR